MDDLTKHLPLAPRDLMILAVLAESPIHGYGLIKAVEDRSETGVLLDPANLYRVLKRMRTAKWIKEVPASEGSRRTYGITPLGQNVLSAEVARLESLLNATRPVLANGQHS